MYLFIRQRFVRIGFFHRFEIKIKYIKNVHLGYIIRLSEAKGKYERGISAYSKGAHVLTINDLIDIFTAIKKR